MESEEHNDDPILPCGVERFYFKDGTSVMLDRVKLVHSIDQFVAAGQVVDENTGSTTATTTRIPMELVVRHVAMGWRNSTRSLHEMPSEVPYSNLRKR